MLSVKTTQIHIKHVAYELHRKYSKKAHFKTQEKFELNQ